MGLIAQLLQDIPAAARYRSELEAMENEIERLKADNARLTDELAYFTDRWESLDGAAVDTLVYLAQVEHGNAEQIAQANRVNIQIVETYLDHLLKGEYVHPVINGSASHYGLANKGRRYLRERGLLVRR